MPLPTRGTKLYIIDPEATGGPELLAIDCAISVDGIEAPREQNESTCLEDTTRRYTPGLPAPGQMTMGLNFDPSSDSHARIVELWRSGTTFEMALGYPDGTALPDIDTAGEFDLPTSRSFLVLHDTYVANVSQSFAVNDLVKANVTFQMSDFPDLFRKV